MSKLAELISVYYKELFCDSEILTYAFYGALSWIPVHYCFRKLYYPLLKKQFAKKLSLKTQISKPVSLRTSGRGTMHFFSMVHAFYVVWSLSKAYTANGYKAADTPDATRFDLPQDITRSANVSCAYWLLDIIPTFFVGANDIQTYLHHFFGCSWVAMLKHLNVGGPGHLHVFYWADFSTIFLQISWFLRDVMGNFDKFVDVNKLDKNMGSVKKMREKISKFSNRSSLLFAFVFFYCRLYKHCCYVPRVVYNIWTYPDEERVPKMWKAHACFIAVMFNVVNVVWSYALVKLVRKIWKNEKVFFKVKKY